MVYAVQVDRALLRNKAKHNQHVCKSKQRVGSWRHKIMLMGLLAKAMSVAQLRGDAALERDRARWEPRREHMLWTFTD